MALTSPVHLQLDVGAVRPGRGADHQLLRSLVPVVEEISDRVGRVVDLTVSVERLGPRRNVELRCWMAGLATVTASSTARTVDRALAGAIRSLRTKVAAIEAPSG